MLNRVLSTTDQASAATTMKSSASSTLPDLAASTVPASSHACLRLIVSAIQLTLSWIMVHSVLGVSSQINAHNASGNIASVGGCLSGGGFQTALQTVNNRQVQSTGFVVAPVPEPGSAVCLKLAVLALFMHYKSSFFGQKV
jgi:hypothetical protein